MFIQLFFLRGMAPPCHAIETRSNFTSIMYRIDASEMFDRLHCMIETQQQQTKALQASMMAIVKCAMAPRNK